MKAKKKSERGSAKDKKIQIDNLNYICCEILLYMPLKREKILNASKKIFNIFKTFFAILGVISTISSIFIIPYTFTPNIELDFISIPESSVSFLSIFKLKNNGLFKIKDIEVENTVDRLAVSKDGPTIYDFYYTTFMSSAGSLQNKKSKSIELKIFNRPIKKIHEVEKLTITLKFKTLFLNIGHKEVFKFKGIITDEGDIYWTPNN